MATARPRGVLVGAVLVLGLALAGAYNTYARAEDDRPLRASTLVDIVQYMEAERLDLEEALADLRADVAAMEERAAEDAGMAESFGRQLDEVRETAGLTGVRGPGVAITLADAENVPPGEDPSACLIHDFDIAGTVNALFAAGAEAVSVNGERIVPTTAVRCAGNTILVNSRRLGNPYEILAIGDPEELEQALADDEGVSALFETYPALYGLDVVVSRSDEIEVPAYRGSLRTDYAIAVGSEG